MVLILFYGIMQPCGATESVKSLQAHCVVKVGEGLMNWTTGVIQAGGNEMLMNQTGYGSKSGRGETSLVEKKSSAPGLFSFSPFYRATYHGRFDDPGFDAGQQEDLDVDRQRLIRILKIISSDYRHKAFESRHTSYQLDVVMARKARNAQIVSTRRGEIAAGTGAGIVLATDIYGDFLDLLYPLQLARIPDIEVIDPENSYGIRKKNTGMIVDAREIGYVPILYPAIVDEQGREIYGALHASREYAVEKGMCSYAYLPDPSLMKRRVGEFPVWVKGLRKEREKGNVIVIPLSDAEKIRKLPERHEFMKACKVMILVPRVLPK